MNERLIEHLFGISNGMYVAMALLMLFGAISYANQKRYHNGLASIHFLMFCVICGFWCYSIFWQHFHSPQTMPYYPDWLYKPTLFITLLTCAISTFTYTRLFGYKWVKRYQLNRQIKFLEYVTYAFNIVSAIYLLSDVSIYTATLVLLANFLLFCGFAFIFTLICADNWVGKIYSILFFVITVYFLILGYFSYTKIMQSHSFLMALSHLLVSFFVLLFCFVSLRFSHKELMAFFHLHTIDEFDIVRDLPKALSDDEFFIEYQPQLDLSTGKITGAEALIRWQHNTKGCIPPYQFIPLAESIDMIDKVTQWLITHTLFQIKKLHDNGIFIPISINFSPMNFNLNMVHFLEKSLQQQGLSSQCIVVEMTENLLLKEDDEAKQSLIKLDNMSISVSIDDYGTGFSSLSYLKKRAINELKIDRSFIMDIHTNKDNLEIVRSTLNMAKNLSLHVVAEGVEDMTTQDILKTLGCDTVQGFGIARPMNGDALIDWIKDNQL